MNIFPTQKRDGFKLAYEVEEEDLNQGFALEVVSLESASKELRADKNTVLKSVAKDGRDLKYVSEELKADKDVVLAAVSNHGWALEYASHKLKADKEVVLAAVSQNQNAVFYMSQELLDKWEFVIQLIQVNKEFKKMISYDFEDRFKVIFKTGSFFTASNFVKIVDHDTYIATKEIGERIQSYLFTETVNRNAMPIENLKKSIEGILGRELKWAGRFSLRVKS